MTSLWVVIFTSCGTLEVGIERTPTEDRSVIATLSNLMLDGTRNAALLAEKKATERAYSEEAGKLLRTPTPKPGLGTVNGKICYPSEGIPAMTAYFRELTTNLVTEMPIADNQETYTIQLNPGMYYAFAWMPASQVGGMYTKAVPCGLTIACTDHDPIVFELNAGETVTGIDICDWVIPLDKLPVPPGYKLPINSSTSVPTPIR
jgi:hypothetical protein